MANDSVITQQKLKEYHETYVYPFLNGISTNGDQAFVPCGKIEGFMRTTAPKGYLVCDGTEYLKSAYPSLAALLASVDTAQSTTNFAGSDSDHFKVPDLRGEFLRGTGTNSHSNQGSGSTVGSHQDATSLPDYWYTGLSDNRVVLTPERNGSQIKNSDTSKNSTSARLDAFLDIVPTKRSDTTTQQGYAYATRPTNTSVLYCIAYQDLYLTPRHTYSTDEHVVGTWIDGKVLYEKTILINSMPNATTTNYAHNIANIDSIVEARGLMVFSSGNALIIPTGYPTNDENSVYVSVQKTQLAIATGVDRSNCSGIITMRYTKTS